MDVASLKLRCYLQCSQMPNQFPRQLSDICRQTLVRSDCLQLLIVRNGRLMIFSQQGQLSGRACSFCLPNRLDVLLITWLT
eukprot:1535591-Pleurochrysis_carterae.AAC.1